MGLFDLFKRTRGRARPAQPVMRSLPEPVVAAPAPVSVTPPDAMELRRMLFDAVATGDEEKLARLCRDHHDFLLEYADTGSIVPDALSANPDAAKWYGDGLHAIARFCAERLDRSELQDRLRAPRHARDLPEPPSPRQQADAYAA